MTRIPTSMTAPEVARLIELARDQVVLEVGSWLGHSTVAMAQVARMVHAVDWHRGDPDAGPERTAHEFLANLRAFDVEDRVIVHIGRAEAFLPLLRSDRFTVGFHDAYHGRDEVLGDAELMARVVTGPIAFHDYGDPRFGVTEAVAELERHGWTITDRVDSLVVLRQPR